MLETLAGSKLTYALVLIELQQFDLGFQLLVENIQKLEILIFDDIKQQLPPPPQMVHCLVASYLLIYVQIKLHERDPTLAPKIEKAIGATNGSFQDVSQKFLQNAVRFNFKYLKQDPNYKEVSSKINTLQRKVPPMLP